MSSRRRSQPPPVVGSSWAPRLVEVTASLVTVVATVLIFGNYVGAHLTFLGDPVTISAEEVRTYWVLVGTASVAVVASVAAAVRRRARTAFVWHLGAAVVAAGVAVAFPVAHVVPADGDPSQPAPTRHPTPAGGGGCLSGGDSDGCVGG